MAPTGATAGQSGYQCSLLFADAVIRSQHVLEGGKRHGPKLQALASGEDGREEGVLICSEKDEQYIGRRALRGTSAGCWQLH